MSDILVNFSCSDPELSREFITEEVWMIASEGPVHEHSIIAMAVIQILFLLLGVPWNIIVVIAILKKHLYKEPTYILLLNLIIADLLVYVCVMPFNIASAIAMKFTIGNSDYARCQVCHTISIVIIALVFVSLFSLALMSIDRLIYIKWPLRYIKYINLKLALILLLFVWIFCILVSILPVFGVGEIKFANVLSSCSLIVGGKTHVTSNISYVVVLVFVGLFPFVAALIANIWLLVIVCKRVYSGYNKNVVNTKSQFTTPVERRDSKQKLKLKYQKQQICLAEVFGAIFAANIVTWMPTIFISFVSAGIGTENVPSPAFAFMFLAFISQPAIHPMLETCLVGRARVVLFKYLCCCCRKKREYSSKTTESRKYSASRTSTA